MDVFSFIGSPSVSGRSLLNFSPLSVPQKKHISKIYASLTANILLTAIGVYVHLNYFAVPSAIAFMLSFACVIGLMVSSQKAHAQSKMLTKERALYFGGFGVVNGMLIANYLHAVHFYVGRSVVPAAFFASVSVFVCLSAAALVAKERSYLYLGSILATALTYFTMASLVNIFFRTEILNNVLLWGGLLMYMGFVVYDTQLAVAHFDMGNRDYLVHALQFYVNFISIFLRLVAILSARQEESNRRKRENRE